MPVFSMSQQPHARISWLSSFSDQRHKRIWHTKWKLCAVQLIRRNLKKLQNHFTTMVLDSSMGSDTRTGKLLWSNVLKTAFRPQRLIRCAGDPRHCKLRWLLQKHKPQQRWIVWKNIIKGADWPKNVSIVYIVKHFYILFWFWYTFAGWFVFNNCRNINHNNGE